MVSGGIRDRYRDGDRVKFALQVKAGGRVRISTDSRLSGIDLSVWLTLTITFSLHYRHMHL